MRTTSLEASITHARILVTLSADDNFCELLVQHPLWHPVTATTAAALVTSSILGPLLRSSILPRHSLQPSRYSEEEFLGTIYFTSTNGDAAGIETVAKLLSSLRQVIHELVRKLLKNVSRREVVLRFFTTILWMSVTRTRTIWGPGQTDDGVFVNILALFLKLSDPFVLPAKFDKLDCYYLLNPTSAFDIFKDNMLVSEEQTAIRLSLAGQAAPHFITTAFFCVLYAIRVGFLPAVDQANREWMSNRRQNTSASNLEIAINANDTEAIPIFRTQVKDMSCVKSCIRAELYDLALCENIMQFYGYFAQWLLLLMGHSPEYPFPKVATASFSALPDFLLGDFADTLICLLRYA